MAAVSSSPFFSPDRGNTSSLTVTGLQLDSDDEDEPMRGRKSFFEDERAETPPYLDLLMVLPHSTLASFFPSFSLPVCILSLHRPRP